MMIRCTEAVFARGWRRVAVLAFVVCLFVAVLLVHSSVITAEEAVLTEARAGLPGRLRHLGLGAHQVLTGIKSRSGEAQVEAAGLQCYVDGTHGSDSYAGSAAQPWRTIGRAAAVAPAGSTVHVLAGYYPERVQVSRPSIAFVAEGAVKMKGFTVWANYITIRGFDITGTPNDQEDGVGIYVEASYCTLEANYIHDATRGGITIYARPGQESSRVGCVVRSNRLYHNAMSGIEIHGRNHILERNNIWGTIQYHPAWTNPPAWVDADGIRFFGAGHRIRGNNIHDITYADPANVNPHIDCFQTWQSDWHEAGRDTIFEGNICRVMESQSIHESGNAFMLAGAQRLLIRNNLLMAFKHINTGGGGNSALGIVNNTMVSALNLPVANHPAGVGLENCPNSIVRNNVFYNLPGLIYYVTGSSTQGLSAGNNLAFRSDGKAPSGSPFPGDLWGVNPRFVNAAGGDFHLQPSSPGVDSGANLGTLVSYDFEGRPRPQGGGMDMGASECNAMADPAQPPADDPVVAPTPVPGRVRP